MLLIGQLLKKTALGSLLNKLGRPKNVKHQNKSCVIGYIGLLSQGKTAYDDMREMLEDPGFYCQALHINSIASPETTRQRLDHLGFELASTNI